MNKSDLQSRLVEFSIQIIELIEQLPQEMAAKHIGGQLLRSGTSPALNYAEARAAESRQDFFHKMKICLKELRESHISLQIIHRRNYLKEETILPALDEANQLVSIFVTSVFTTEKNNPKK